MRKLIMAGLLVLVAQSASAQTAGVKGGFTSSKFSGTEPTAPTLGRLPAFGGGAFIQLGRGPIGLQFELLALTKGAKVADTTADDHTAKIKINYVEIPVNAIVHLPLGPYLFGGPAVALENGCQQEIKTQNLKISSDCRGQGVFNRHKLELSALAGAGIQHAIGRHIFFVEARQEFGINNIDAESGGNLKNRTFAVFVGYAAGMRRH